ncbi:ABC transporter substrate-binding protein [Halorussus salilacus]|uniref:ABC transporter substrate-binding protein n=1 Tax=Halorussus salilacus TaxID=2953750 RepID=UPI00209E5C5C|nr:ABC transporter substrate-binding protein [Halorussus salilacus]USZ69363.1 ABC transporter substrate-binding protein [Halorussus salilacus]
MGQEDTMLDDDGSRLDGRRRALLAGVAGVATASTAGCVRRVRSIANRDPSRQVSLEVKTVPADIDSQAAHIARIVTERLTEVGIDASVTPMDEQELLRDVLINKEFDIYVAQHPGYDDPDFLRSLLHSKYIEEPGWQNPFGYSDLDVDELLDVQRRRHGSERHETLAELQETVAQQQPFTVVAFPDDVWGARTDRFEGWNQYGLGRPLGYLALDPVSDDAERVDLLVTDDRLTKNLNPLATEFRNRGTFTGLLYDPLARRYDESLRPWLAEDWEWTHDASDDRPVASVTLREDVTWHDGESLTASDVVFTYRFLADTSLGSDDGPVPAPMFRSRVSLVDNIEQVDSRTVEIAFVPSDPSVAERAFTVPILPERIWESKSSDADVAGIDLGDRTTEAVVWDNPEPVGSGPLQFEEKDAAEQVVFSRFDDHFLHDDSDDERPRFEVGFEELVLQVAPSEPSAVELLETEEADAMASPVSPSIVPRLARSSDINLVVETSRSFYHLGFNVQRPPLGNPRFRRNVARLLDKEHVASEVFDGYAIPAASPLAVTDWEASDLSWDGEDPVLPFFGSDGELDVEAAREAFRQAGYRYDGNTLVNR